MSQPLVELSWLLIGFSLTLMTLSYILGDNPFFRIAAYLLVGTAAGYLFVVVLFQVIIQRVLIPIFSLSGTISVLTLVLALLPLLASLLLLGKLLPGNLSVIGNFPLAYVVGVGAAVMISGVVTGTILGQSMGAINAFGSTGLIEALILLVGTISTLAYFHYGARTNMALGGKRSPLVEGLAWAGKVFIGSYSYPE